ncbi:putative F-box domain-containing protein [Tanacetum coccineum]|uniref:F-box domain-containing protein n=1 Tax=Tanacetum coccineum TaxID=301880 RepID=A0ABQ5CL45_9ASTR
MAELVPDVLEKILITLDVTDLIRCKSVCKFWHSLISRSLFVTAHMNHGYNNDRMYHESGHRRILMSCPGHEYNCYILGSANGLACIKAGVEIFVANPSTREVKNIQKKVPEFIILKRSVHTPCCASFKIKSGKTLEKLYHDCSAPMKCLYPMTQVMKPLRLAVWGLLMKNYNVPHSWTAFPSRHARKHNDVEHYLKNLKDYVPNTSIFDENIKYRQDLGILWSPIICTKSLYLPYFTGRQKRKNDAHSS